MSARRPSGHPRNEGAARRRTGNPPRREGSPNLGGAKVPMGAAPSGPRRHKPSIKPNAKPGGRPATKKTTSRNRRAPVREARFTKKFNVRFSGGERTRQFSMRMLAVLLFAAISVVIVASPLSQYLDQQQQKRELLRQLEETTARVELLEQELARWQDDDFVRSQARERLGYVLPGETLYLASDPAKGTPEEIVAERAKEVNDRRRQATPFYLTMWDSIQIAGASGQIVNPSNTPIIGTTPTDAPSSETPGIPGDETSPTPTGEEESAG
ncbi:septum formation initiator family protein [Trueperella pyogenes]|uniref:FtsB family cell division protein n=1 Tax=Trueperella pyogenes TaxID=1661 RepID=UPI0009B82C30|nr:septum formation initiator family protein [Trueperella pyogenes]